MLMVIISQHNLKEKMYADDCELIDLTIKNNQENGKTIMRYLSDKGSLDLKWRCIKAEGYLGDLICNKKQTLSTKKMRIDDVGERWG